MVLPPKYNITVVKPPWYLPYGDLGVQLDKYDGRTRKYKAVPVKDVGVQDLKRREVVVK